MPKRVGVQGEGLRATELWDGLPPAYSRIENATGVAPSSEETYHKKNNTINNNKDNPKITNKNKKLSYKNKLPGKSKKIEIYGWQA